MDCIGKNIQELRKLKGLTQEELAEKLNISTHHISSVERGLHSLRLNSLIDLMNILECSPNQIFKGLVNTDEQPQLLNISTKLKNLPLSEQQRILAVMELLIDTAPKK